MPQYMIAVYHRDDFDPSTETEATMEAIHALNREMIAAGARKFACGISPVAEAKSVRYQSDGNVAVTDGPYTETKEHIGGFWLVEAADMNEALEWARKGAAACHASGEVRALLFKPDPKGRGPVKYICLGYYDKNKFDGMTEAERNDMFDACFEYDDHLRANGHYAHGESLQPPETALTLSWKNGKVATTDGPYAETKEQIGGLVVLEARDMNHAVQLMSQHPSLRYCGIWEIRPVGDMTEIRKASEARRRKNARRDQTKV